MVVRKHEAVSEVRRGGGGCLGLHHSLPHCCHQASRTPSIHLLLVNLTFFPPSSVLHHHSQDYTNISHQQFTSFPSSPAFPQYMRTDYSSTFSPASSLLLHNNYTIRVFVLSSPFFQHPPINTHQQCAVFLRVYCTSTTPKIRRQACPPLSMVNPPVVSPLVCPLPPLHA